MSPSTSARRPPAAARLLVALLLSLAGSLVLDALLVAAGTAAFPATKGYGHFHFSDYGVLTAIGVVLAWAAWVVVAQLAPDPRRDFFRLAVGVTVGRTFSFAVAATVARVALPRLKAPQ